VSPESCPTGQPLTAAILLRSSNPAGLLFWCVIGLGAGLYLFVQGFRMLQRRKLILDTPVSKVRSASMGLVEMNGLAVGPYTMAAPITARACYYYRTVVWEWKQAGKNKQWVKVAGECMHLPFFLDDNTGKVMIDPRGADLDLHRDFQQEFCDGFFTTKEEAPPNVRDFLMRHGVSTTNKIKVEEFCIKPKNWLFVLGTLDENPGLELTSHAIADAEPAGFGSGSGFSLSLGGSPFSLPRIGAPSFNAPSFLNGLSSEREQAFMESVMAELPASASDKTVMRSTQVIRLSPDQAQPKTSEMTQQQKIAAALMKAGITSPAAWAAAGVTPNGAASDVHGQTRPGVQVQAPEAIDGFDSHPPVVLMKGKNNSTFLISWRSQRDLARSLGWKCSLMIWGGPILALLSLYGLLELSHLF